MLPAHYFSTYFIQRALLAVILTEKPCFETVLLLVLILDTYFVQKESFLKSALCMIENLECFQKIFLQVL